MARVLTPKDIHVLMNSLVRQATGQSNLVVSDTSSFISAGETLMQSPKENIMSALTMIMGRTFSAAREYRGNLWMLNAINTGVYTSRFRKISFYSKDAMASGYYNTDLYTNFAEGFTAGENKDANGVPQSTKSQWEQTNKYPLEVTFGGSSVWSDGLTRYVDKLEAAFRDESEFANFITGMAVDFGNDIESQREAFNRMTLISEIAKRHYLTTQNIIQDGSINMTAAFNTRYGVNYTTQQLLSTYYKEFLAFFVAQVKTISDRMAKERSTAYHDPFTKTFNGVSHSILRHTPYDKQRIMLYGPFIRDAESMILPEIFHDNLLDINKQFEKVEFWQSNGQESDRPQINVNTAYLDKVTGEQKATGAVSIPMVLGCIFDEDAVMTDMVLDTVRSTPVEARKGIINTWYSFARNAIGDQTENFVTLYMQDPTP